MRASPLRRSACWLRSRASASEKLKRRSRKSNSSSAPLSRSRASDSGGAARRGARQECQVKVRRGEVQQHLHKLVRARVSDEVVVVDQQQDVARMAGQATQQRDGHRLRVARIVVAVVEKGRLAGDRRIDAIQAGE